MELVKKLPDVFEEFGEQRRNAFTSVFEIKENDIPIVGTFCTYTPVEIIMAAGAIPVSLCSASDETIPDAEQDLPRNLCPLVKSSYGFAKTQKCPYFYFADLIVGETTCDGKKKMFELLGEIKDVHYMLLSQLGIALYKYDHNDLDSCKHVADLQSKVLSALHQELQEHK